MGFDGEATEIELRFIWTFVDCTFKEAVPVEVVVVVWEFLYCSLKSRELLLEIVGRIKEAAENSGLNQKQTRQILHCANISIIPGPILIHLGKVSSNY